MTIDDVLRSAFGLWPRAFSRPEQADAWANLYRSTLGNLGPIALDTAWNKCLAAHDGMRPPMPADVLKHVPAVAIASSAPAVRGRAMAEALPGIVTELLSDWWRTQGAWVDGQLDERGVEEERRPSVRRSLNDGLKRAAHYQAQILFHKGDDSRVLDIDIAEGYFRRWIDNCWTAGLPINFSKQRRAA